jgi:hypothetical protein
MSNVPLRREEDETEGTDKGVLLQRRVGFRQTPHPLMQKEGAMTETDIRTWLAWRQGVELMPFASIIG